ncbi:hypothetical protein KAI58_04345 [Candidatus Gracilibacteria bacterium]|nr:hypothetical protein [Candidatus Gracilibacteria bacterium]
MKLSPKAFILKNLHGGLSPKNIMQKGIDHGYESPILWKTFKNISAYQTHEFFPKIKKFITNEKNAIFAIPILSIKNYETQIREQLFNGKSPEKIFQEGLTAGIPEQSLFHEFYEITQFPTTPFVTSIVKFLQTQSKNPSLKDIPNSFKKSHKILLKNKILWDPSGNIIRENFFDTKQRQTWEKIKFYQKNPFSPQRKIIVLSILSILSIFIGFLFFLSPIFWEIIKINGEVGNYIIIIIATILFIPIYLLIKFFWEIKALQIDGIKMLIAQKNKWVYSPNKNYLHSISLAKKFEEIFNLQLNILSEKKLFNQDDAFQDEFWGKFQNKDFWMGLLNLEFATVAIRLDKTLEDVLLLTPSNSKKTEIIGVESSAISTGFDVILYKNKTTKKNHNLEILKKISPYVQDKMNQLLQSMGYYSILFKKDCVIFLFEKRFLENMKTNFLKKIEINAKDETYLKEKLQTILKITHEFGKYLK